MTRNVAVLAYDLAVAVISMVLFAASLVWLATHQISWFYATFMLIGCALAGAVAIFKFQQDKEPSLVKIEIPTEMPAQKTVRPSRVDWVSTGRTQRA